MNNKLILLILIIIIPLTGYIFNRLGSVLADNFTTTFSDQHIIFQSYYKVFIAMLNKKVTRQLGIP